MIMIDVNGTQLYYEITGEGPPLLMITGFSVASDCWSLVVPELAKHFKVVTFDNRGSGRSAVPEGGYPIELLANDAMALCKALGVEKPHVLGSSMGGGIAQTIAKNFEINKLVLCNTTIKFSKITRLLLKDIGRQLEIGTPIEEITERLMLWLFASNTLEDETVYTTIRQAIIDQPYPCPLEGYKNQSLALNSFDSRKWAKSLKQETLVIGSTDDRLTLECETKALADAIPRSKYTVISNCGHNPQQEAPDRFLSAVISFLQQ